MSWDRPFDEPIPLPGGKVIKTLREGGEYILSLPARQQKNEKWHNAAEALTLVAEHQGPVMFARMAFMLALNQNVSPPPLTGQMDRSWGKKPLKRDMQ